MIYRENNDYDSRSQRRTGTSILGG
jgi:hypothetical protein